MDDEWRIATVVREPRSAAIAGIVFGLILIGVLVLLQAAAPGSVVESGGWVTDAERRDAMSKALTLIPFAGIAFIWFIAVARSSLRRYGDRFFDAVLMGSGLVFVAMLFTAAAVLMAALTLSEAGTLRDPEFASHSWVLASALLGSFGARMAAVFALAASSAGLRVGSMPRSLALMGYLTGALLLLTPPLPRWARLLFPLWVMAISTHVLWREHSNQQPVPPLMHDGS